MILLKMIDRVTQKKTLHYLTSGNKLEGDMGDTVSLQAQTSPYFQLREKFKCIEHMDNSEPELKTSP